MLLLLLCQNPTALLIHSSLPFMALASYNHFQHLVHDNSKDPFSSNLPISYAKKAVSPPQKHDQPTVSSLPSGKLSIHKIESVAGKYKISSCIISLDHST